VDAFARLTDVERAYPRLQRPTQYDVSSMHAADVAFMGALAVDAGLQATPVPPVVGAYTLHKDSRCRVAMVVIARLPSFTASCNIRLTFMSPFLLTRTLVLHSDVDG
jgi:hypothetical protein